eukprot:m.138666 g.138666  ORF g.138666 m.138666 type:complete len:2662 (+) comp38253_c0_seq2:210-8195(+)
MESSQNTTDDIPDAIIGKIAREIAKGPMVARLLDVKESVIEKARHNWPSDVDRQTVVCLQAWRSQQGSSASYAQLREALENACCPKAVQIVDEETNFVFKEETQSSQSSKADKSESIQQLKGVLSVNACNWFEIEKIAAVLDVSPSALVKIKENCPSNPGEQTACIVTKWMNREGSEGTAEKLRSQLIAGGLERACSLYSPSDKCHKQKMLKSYLEYLIANHRYVKILGIKDGGCEERLKLEKVYVSLRVDKESTAYQRYHSKVHMEMEMKKYLEQQGVNWDELNDEGRAHVAQKYLSELPPTVNPMLKLEREQEDSPDDTPFACAFCDHPALVVLGDPGSGKTTMVRWLCLKLAAAFLVELERESGAPGNVVVPYTEVDVSANYNPLQNSANTIDLGPVRLPVFVRVADFARFMTEKCKNKPKSNHSLVDFLGSCPHHGDFEIQHGVQIFGQDLSRIIKDMLEKNRVVVILDGLDEVPTARRAVVEAVEDFINSYLPSGDSDSDQTQTRDPQVKGNQVVITSRIAGYAAATLLHKSVVHSLVRRMNKFSICQFCDNWMKAAYLDHARSESDDECKLREAKKAAADLQRAICSPEHPSLYYLASNPLLLTVLALIYRRQNYLPHKRAELYDVAISYLADTWRSTKEDRVEKDPGLDATALVESLVEVAHHIHENSKTGYIQKSELLKLLVESYCFFANDTKIGRVGAIASQLFQTLHEDVGLLVEKAHQRYGFIHLSFEEFLAGRRLIREESPYKTVIEILRCGFDPRWKEPIMLGLGYASMTWPRRKFNSVLHQLIENARADDIVPRSSLLVVHAFSEFEEGSVEKEVVERLLRQLIQFYSRNSSRPSGFVCVQVLSALRRIADLNIHKEMVPFVLKSLVNAGSHEDSCTAALLLEQLNLLDSDGQKELSSSLHKDMPTSNWPIHGALRRKFSPDPFRLLQISLHPEMYAGDGDSDIEIEYRTTLNFIQETAEKAETFNKTLESLLEKRYQPFLILLNDLAWKVNDSALLTFCWLKTIAVAASNSAVKLKTFLSSTGILDESASLKVSSALTAVFCCFSPSLNTDMSILMSILNKDLTSDFMTLLCSSKDMNFEKKIKDALFGLFQLLTREVSLLVQRSGFSVRLDRLLKLMLLIPEKEVTEIMNRWAACFVFTTHSLVEKMRARFSDSTNVIIRKVELIQESLTVALQSNINLIDPEDDEVDVSCAIEEMRKCCNDCEELDETGETLTEVTDQLRHAESCEQTMNSILGLSSETQKNRVKFKETQNAFIWAKLNYCPPKVPASNSSEIGKFLREDNCKMLVRLKQNSSLIRVFVALFGGVGLVRYPDAVRAHQARWLQKSLSKFEKEQLRTLRLTFEENELISKQRHHERMVFSWKSIMKLEFYKAVQPLLRLEYMYRESSAFDRQIIDVLQGKNQGTKALLCAAREAWKEKTQGNIVVHDAALVVCAVGGAEEICSLLHEKDKAIRDAILLSLSEALSAICDPACRAWMHLVTADALKPILNNSANGASLLKKLVTLLLELGGRPDPGLFMQLYRNCDEITVRLYLAAEVLACVLSQIEYENGQIVSYEDFIELFPITTDSNKIELAAVLLLLSKTCSLHWWGRKRTVLVQQMQSSCDISIHSSNLIDIFSFDVLNALRGIQKTSSVTAMQLLALLHPDEGCPEVQTIWEVFDFCLKARDLYYKNWMSLLTTRDKLKDKVAKAVANSTDFIIGQALIIIIEFSPEEERSLFQLLVLLARKLNSRLESFQLLYWVHPHLSTEDKKIALDLCQSYAEHLDSLLARARCYIRLASKYGLEGRMAFLKDALSFINRASQVSREDESSLLVLALEEIKPFVSTCHSKNMISIHDQHASLLRTLPDSIRTRVRSDLLYPACEELLSHIAPGESRYEFCSILCLASRLRDILVEAKNCLELRSERHVWSALWHGWDSHDSQLITAAFTKLQGLIKCGNVDLTMENALLLETMLLSRDEQAANVADFLPYLCSASFDAVQLLSTWFLCKDFSQDVTNVAGLNWAEVYGLNGWVKRHVDSLRGSEIDVCRHRAEELYLRSWRPYYTAFEHRQFLLGIDDAWLLHWIWHNNVSFFEEIVAIASESSETASKSQALFLLENICAVDNAVGAKALDYLCCCSSFSTYSVRKALFSSICTMCYLDEIDNCTIPDNFCKLLSDKLLILFVDPDETEMESMKLYCSDEISLLNEACQCLSASKHALLGPHLINKLDNKCIENGCRLVFEKNYPSVSKFIQIALFYMYSGKDNDSKTSVKLPALERFKKKIEKMCEEEKLAPSLNAKAIKLLLSEIVRQGWITHERAMNPVGRVIDAAKEVNPQVLEVFAEWTRYVLENESVLKKLYVERHHDTLRHSRAGFADLMVCLGAMARRTPSALLNFARRYDYFTDLLVSVVQKSRSFGFVARQGALTALTSLGRLTRESAKCLLDTLRDNRFTSTTTFIQLQNINSAENEAIAYLCSRLKSKSSLEVVAIARLLGSLATHGKLTLRQRSDLASHLQEAANEFLKHDQPLYPVWLSGKVYDLQTLSSILSETLAKVSKILLEELAAIPYQLGEPDAQGVYKYKADTATPIWYKYRPSRNCWYWTPEESYNCWMPVSTNIVRKGGWAGESPVHLNRECIQILNQLNPKPSEEIIGYDDESVFERDFDCP